jgi:hypothetical protein
MKHSITIFSLLFTLTANQLLAQDNNDNPREKFTVGLKAGMNFSNVWDEKGQDFQADGKLGFIAGAFVAIPFGEWIGVQPEVHISQKGMQASGTVLFTPYTFTRTTTYLDIPLLFQLKPSDYFTIVAGPQFSYLLNEKNVYTFGGNSAEQEQEFNNEDPRKNILGFAGGIDVNIQHFVISARASFDFQNNNGNGTSTTPRYKNQLIQLTVGFKI